jgi:hypothetical protein
VVANLAVLQGAHLAQGILDQRQSRCTKGVPAHLPGIHRQAGDLQGKIEQFLGCAGDLDPLKIAPIAQPEQGLEFFFGATDEIGAGRLALGCGAAQLS